MPISRKSHDFSVYRDGGNARLDDDKRHALEPESEEEDDRMSIYRELVPTDTRMITSNEATDAVLASDLAELIKSLSLRMGTMQRQIETIMTGGTTEPVPLDKDEALKLPVNTLSQRSASYHKQSVDILAIRQEVRSYTRERLRIVTGDKEAWPTADSVLVDDANNNTMRRDIPDPHHLALDWGTKGLTTWTRDCVIILANEFHINHGNGAFPTIQHLHFTVKSVSRMFKDYLIYLKREYHHTITDAPSAARTKAFADKRARSLGRRQQLLRRRKAMVKHHHFPDIAVEILEKLDKAGMSSEDSDGEPGTGTGTGRTFRIKRLPWRSSELTEWLHRIDNMPTKNANGAVLAKMAVYRNRISSDIESQARSPVHRLPRRFYRAEWMRLQSKRAVKEFAVSGVDVSLPKIDEFLPK